MLFEHRIDPRGEFSCHRHDSFSSRPIARMALVHRAVELPQFRVLANRRPRGLDQFTAQPPVATAGDAAPYHPIPGRLGYQTEKPRQLSHVGHLLRIANTCQQMTGHDLTDSRNAFQKHHGPTELGILAIKPANLFGGLYDSLLGGLHALHELIELEAHDRRAGKLLKLLSHDQRPLAASGRLGKLKPFEQQQGFNSKFHGHSILYKCIPELNQLAQLAIRLRGHVNALQLPASEVFREPIAVEAVGLHSLSRHLGDHRRGGHHANVALRGQPIIQTPPRGAS